MRRTRSGCAARTAGLGVSLRPHLKTAKSVDAASFVLGTPPGPATVSTLKEAEMFGAHGITDLLYAVCISPQKLDRVTSCAKAASISRSFWIPWKPRKPLPPMPGRSGDRLPVLIEIDVDDHRSGVHWIDRDTLIGIGKILAPTVPRPAWASCAMPARAIICTIRNRWPTPRRSERARILQAAQSVARCRLAPAPSSAWGPRPRRFPLRTMRASPRSGPASICSSIWSRWASAFAALDDIALSVLATVIGHQRDKNWIITDAGWMALSADRGTAGQAVDQYYGLVCDIEGRPFEDLVVLRANQEHGIIAARPGSSTPIPSLAVGDRVRILPNHACATAAQHEQYHLMDDAMMWSAIWPRFRGW